MMDFEAIKKAAEAYGPQMNKFLRDLIRIPSESCQEERLSPNGSSVLGVCREGLPFLPSLLCVGLYVVF